MEKNAAADRRPVPHVHHPSPWLWCRLQQSAPSPAATPAPEATATRHTLHTCKGCSKPSLGASRARTDLVLEGGWLQHLQRFAINLQQAIPPLAVGNCCGGFLWQLSITTISKHALVIFGTYIMLAGCLGLLCVVNPANVSNWQYSFD